MAHPVAQSHQLRGHYAYCWYHNCNLLTFLLNEIVSIPIVEIVISNSTTRLVGSA